MLGHSWITGIVDGIPNRFHSDGANNVHGHVMRELCNYLGLDKSKSSRLHPQGDGTAEAFVKQLKLCIQKQVQLNGTDWDLNLQSAAFAIRSSTANSTQVTPAELVLGTKLIQPIDKVLPTQLQDVQPLPHNQRQASQFAKSLVNKLNETISITQNNLLKSRARMKHSFDKHTTPIPINVGDHVMLWTPYKKQNLSRCFQPNWSGPWIVQQYTGPTNCKLINDKGHIKNVHVNQLKRIEERHIHLSDSNYKQTTHHVNDNVSQPRSSCTEIFNLFDENNIETLRNVTPEQTEHNVINRAWVDIAQNNILPTRTRSGGTRGEGGV